MGFFLLFTFFITKFTIKMSKVVKNVTPVRMNGDHTAQELEAERGKATFDVGKMYNELRLPNSDTFSRQSEKQRFIDIVEKEKLFQVKNDYLSRQEIVELNYMKAAKLHELRKKHNLNSKVKKKIHERKNSRAKEFTSVSEVNSKKNIIHE